MLLGEDGNKPSLIFLLLVLLLAAAAAAIVIMVRRPALAHAGRRSGTAMGYLPFATATTEKTQARTTSAVTSASGVGFTTSDGDYIPLKDKGGKMGRDNFRAFIPSDKANLISREHVRVDIDNGDYYIEDLDSTNGTRVNGSNIEGKGRILLNRGDTITLADALTINFKL
jgi:hypothetical protein